MNFIRIFLKRTRGLIHYGILLLKIGGVRVFLKQLKRQIYSRSVQVGFTMDLVETDVPKIEARIKYTLKLASEDDMAEVLQKAKSESKDMAQKLIFRKWLYDDGYHNCYLARTADTNELCFIQFTIFSEEYNTNKGRFMNWLPELKEDEALIEGAYTFEKCRGKRIHPAVTAQQLRICQERGIKRVIAQVEKNNLASIKGTERAGYKPFKEVMELKVMFFTFRTDKRINKG